MEKLAHSFGLRRSTRSFAKLSSQPSPQPSQQQPINNIRSASGNKENVCRASMGPPMAPVAGHGQHGKSHMPISECDPSGSKRAMLSTSTCSEKSQSSQGSSSSSKKVNASWDRRLSVGIKRTISKLKLNSKSNKSNYLPVVDFPETEQPSPNASSISSMSMVGQPTRSKGCSSAYDTGGHAMYRSGIGASLDQLNTVGSGGNKYYENQAMSYQMIEPQQQQRRQHSSTANNVNCPPPSSNNGGVLGAPAASPYIARAPRMGTSALRYSRDTTANSRPSRLDQSFNAMLPVAEEHQDASDGNAEAGGFLWKAGWLSRYNLRSSQSRLSMSYADDPIVAGGGVDDSYMAEDLDDTRTGEGFNISVIGMPGSNCK